jgi:hypothetical protein
MLVLPADRQASNKLVDLTLTSQEGNEGAVLLEWVRKTSVLSSVFI